MLTRFDGLNKELQYIKDIIVNNLPIENQRLPSKINKRRYRLTLRRKLTENPWEQYSWRNNLKLTGISDNTEGEKLDEKVN